MNRLNDFETHIKVKAREFARREDDVQDFEQVGRLAAWEAIQADPNATKGFVYNRIEWRMINYAKRSMYKNPPEISANETFAHMLWGDFVGDE